MSDYVNETLLDPSPIRKQKEESQKLVTKWEKSGLLEGMDGEWQRSGMAVLLENQARQLLSEASKTSPSAGTGVGDEEWSGVALPLVRRVFGNIVAQELVSVQPMNLPSGLVFYLDFKYGTAVGKFSADTSIHGNTGPNSPSGSTGPWGEDSGFYGAGRYGYSISASSIGVDMGDAWDGTQASNKDIDFNTEVSASCASGHKFFKVTGSISALTRPDKKAVRAWDISFSGVKEFPQFRSLSGDTLTLIVSSSATAATTGSYTVKYLQETTAGNRGDFEDRVGNATVDQLSIPEVNLELRSLPIVAKTRKLKAVWTPELAQDLNAYHSVDAEAELTSMLSEYISMEIDLEILDMLISDAVTQDYWSVTPGEDYDGSGTDETAWAITTFYGTRFEWWQTLVQKIQKVSNEIHRLTLRGGANFAVVSPKVATILESLPGYMSNTDGNKAQFAMGVQSIGSIQNRWNVYKNPYMTENQILIGFRGSNFLETGAVYAPYVPLIMTPLVYDPSDFTPRKGVMTRYAKKMIRPEFYGKIAIKDLNLI